MSPWLACAQVPAVGLHYGSDFSTSQYEAFGTWLGSKVMYRVVFLEKDNWSKIANPTVLGVTAAWVKSLPGRGEVISVALLPDNYMGQFNIVTSGAHDADFKSLASKIQAQGIADKVIIRLGWEGNGSWYAWNFQKDTAGYISAYRRAVQVMRSVAPLLRFEFNISSRASRNGGAKWSDGYPGDDVVDIISMDIYDHWNTWSSMMTGDAGLAEMRTFATAHNKLESFAEWSCSTLAHGFGDDPTFVTNMHNWMLARPGKVLYQSYWNTSDGANALVYGANPMLIPNASAQYKTLFNASVPANQPPTISAITDLTINEDAATGAVTFSVGDSQTPASSLVVKATCSNVALIPSANLVLGGSGANRTIAATPAHNANGKATISITVSDGTLTAVRAFALTVNPINDAPTITHTANKTAVAGTVLATTSFTVSDVETAAGSLVVSATSSNTSLLPGSGIVLGGTGSSRTLTLKPTSAATGSATVTLQVSDGTATAKDTFTLTISAPVPPPPPPNTAPTISPLASVTVPVNGSTTAIVFTIGDVETSASSLILSKGSSDISVVPVENITFGGSGANRTVMIKPVSNKTGSSTITVKVSDGLLASSASFTLNVSGGLIFTDVGAPQIKGAATLSGNNIQVTAGGYDIYNLTDEFCFGQMPLTGDVELTVHVSSLTAASDWTKAGLMFRESLAPDAAFIAVFVTPGHGTVLQWRSKTGGWSSSSPSWAIKMPCWLRLVRSANSFFAFASTDGTTWDLVETHDVVLPEAAPAGLAVTSHIKTAATTATFDSFGVD